MTDTIARLRRGSKTFEVMVDLEAAMQLRKGKEVDMNNLIRDESIWADIKKGLRAGKGDLTEAFQTSDFSEVAKKIVEKGDIEVTKEYRDEELEKRKKQVVDFLVRNAIDARTNRPFTPDTISSAIDQSGVKIENKPVDAQISNILEKLRSILPIKIETKKIEVKIPAQLTGRAYGVVQEYKEKETWLGNGDLEVVLNIPVGLQSEFYDKLNSITHGSALTKELK
jgi:ribosome maturation protein SDO1